LSLPCQGTQVGHAFGVLAHDHLPVPGVVPLTHTQAPAFIVFVESVYMPEHGVQSATEHAPLDTVPAGQAGADARLKQDQGTVVSEQSKVQGPSRKTPPVHVSVFVPELSGPQ
jgi:hypothetical protein